jgi:hypothetical protein
MTKLRISIETQRDKMQEISEKYDYFTIKDPIFDTIHMSILCKNELQEQTKMITEHFYNIEELTDIYRGNYDYIKKTLTWNLVVYFIFIIISFTIIIITFSFLENKALSLIPLISLITCTLLICIFVLNALRLRMINNLIDGEYKIDRKYIFLILYRMKKEQFEKKSVFGFADECLSLKDDCLN